MPRALVVLLLLVVPASAQKKPTTAAQANAANDAALRKALAAQKLKPIKLAAVPALDDEISDESHFIANVVFDKSGHHDPIFAVDANKNVFRVTKKLNVIGRVKAKVCHGGPQRPLRVKRTRFDVPAGHKAKDDIEITVDVFVIDEQNTCK